MTCAGKSITLQLFNTALFILEDNNYNKNINA